jgi:flavin-dependent dehydrogenase
MKVDVLVVGGGPGGAACATKLAERGRRVLVLEREVFPRFHLGESLLPQTMPLLESLGVMPAMRERFIPKYGAHFHFDQTGQEERYVFASAFEARYDHAFQVPRDEFDELLLRNAARAGADVRHQWTANRIRFEGDVAVGAEATDPDGNKHTIDASMVVDATGRDALLARDRRNKTRIDRLDKSAFYTHYRNTKRHTGVEEGDIDVVVFPGGWFWFIPFKDGRTSVGAVVSRAWMKGRRDGESVDALYLRAIAESRVATRMLEGAQQLWPGEAAADYSFRVKDLCGDGWLAVGDAGGFIDPLFSTGAHLAIDGGIEAALAIDLALEAGDVSRARFEPWARRVRGGTSLFLQMVGAFYEGALQPLLFADEPHPFLRKAITSMLSGHVFDEDARWVRDVRTRFAPSSYT